MNLAELRKQKHETVAAMKKILEAAETDNRDLNEDEQSRYDELGKGLDGFSNRIQRIESFDAKRGPSVGEMSATATVTAIPERGATTVTQPWRAHAPEAKREFECLAEVISAVNEARSGRREDQRLAWQDFHAEQRMDDGPKGGFHVPAQFVPEILRVTPAELVITANCKKIGSPNSSHPDAPVTMPALDQTGNQFGGVTVSRIGEGQTKPETDADSRLVTWTPSELAGHVAYTDQLLRNWPGARTLIDEQLGGALASMMEQEAFSGAGGLQFTGIRDHASAITIARNTADTFLFADLVQMASAALDRPGFKCWVINTRLRGAVMSMQNAAGFMLWQPGLVAGQPGALDGKPVYWYEYAGAQGALGAVALLNLDYYVMHQASGYFVDVGWINDDFTRNKRRVKMFTMNDARPWLTAPFTLANGETASPFVLLGANP